MKCTTLTTQLDSCSNINALQFVHGELLQIAGQCLLGDVARFPALQQSLLSAVEAFINTGAV